jgi:hypothetical protein
MYHNKPVKVGVGIGAFGALFILLTTALLFIVPQELMSSTGSSAYVETWSQPIMLVGGFVYTMGIPLASAVAAYHLTTTDETPENVIFGFFIGGFVFIAGNAILGVAVTNLFAYGAGIERSLLGHLQNSLPHGMRLFLGGLFGAAGALVVDDLL